MSGALTADIQPPDIETRIAILRKKAKDDNLVIDQEILSYIATHVNPTSGSWKEHW